MKKLAIIILTFGLVVLSACASAEPDATDGPRPMVDKPIASKSAHSQTESKKDLSESAGDRRTASSQAPQVSEPQDTASSSSSAATQSNSYKIKDDTPAEKSAKLPGSSDTESPKTPTPRPPQPPEQKPTPEPTPAPTPKPTLEPTLEPTPDPTPEPTPEPVPSFDVSEYVGYAQSYGSNIGLSLDGTATSCWDDPLAANSGCSYLKRDLKDRLDWYAASGFTAFCVWAEDAGGGNYLIYIGYA